MVLIYLCSLATISVVSALYTSNCTINKIHKCPSEHRNRMTGECYAQYNTCPEKSMYDSAAEKCVVPHIRSISNGNFWDICKNPQLIPMDSHMQEIIIKEFNNKRNFMASGKVPGHYARACRMGTMRWHPELAELAEQSVRRCSVDHDYCHNTDEFKLSGQNIAWNFTLNSLLYPLIPEEQVVYGIRNWFDEYKLTEQHEINAYPKFSKRMIGHFTVMVQDKNIYVGCAAVFHDVNVYNIPEIHSMPEFLFICNFARTNVITARVIEKCNDVARNCTSGTNKEFPNLCSEMEEYDVNKYDII